MFFLPCSMLSQNKTYLIVENVEDIKLKTNANYVIFSPNNNKKRTKSALIDKIVIKIKRILFCYIRICIETEIKFKSV